MYIYQKKRNGTWKRRLLDQGIISFIVLCLLLFFLIHGAMLLEQRLMPIVISIAEIKANMVAIDAVNKAIMEKVARETFYRDLIAIEQDEQGRIIMAQVNRWKLTASWRKQPWLRKLLLWR